MRAATAFVDLPDDAACHVVARQQFGRPPCLLVPLRVAPPLFLVVGGLVLVEVGDVVEHEAAALAVAQRAPLAPHCFRHQDAPDRRRPDHPGRMELHELHVQQLGAGTVGERLSVAGVLPTVRCHLEGAADATRGQDDRPGPEDAEPSPLAVVAERADNPVAVLQQLDDGALHVHVDPLVDAMVLQGPDHLQPGPVTDVREARIAVAAVVALQEPPVGCPVEDGAPRLELAHPVGCLLRVDLRHPPVVQILPAPHRVGEVGFPGIPVVHVGEGGRHPPFGHHGMRLAKERLADQADRDARRGCLNRRAEAGAAGADHEDVMFECLVIHRTVA